MTSHSDLDIERQNNAQTPPQRTGEASTMYTAIVTRMLGNQTETVEVPCRNIDTFYRTADWINTIVTKTWNTKPFNVFVSHCPYGMIISAQRKGEYVLATLHQNGAT